MKSIKPILLAMLAALIIAGVSGCYESPLITWYEPHEYKGKGDPLTDKLKKTELQQQLVQRFKKVQTDR
jgi:hypothetical protein